jgi:Ca-activated chloride channel family protein
MNKKIQKIVVWFVGIILILLILGLGLLFLNNIFGGSISQFKNVNMQIDGGMYYPDQSLGMPFVPPNGEPYDTTFFENYGTNPFISTEDEVFSTFGMDVDTASYTVARRWITDGNIPDNDSVRTEEFINYFDQDYPNPNDNFDIFLEGAKSHFGQPNYHMLKIGIKAKEVSLAQRKPANMVFLVDVSGSMNREDRLELVKKSLTLLANKLKQGDKVGLAVYAGGGGKILDLTNDKNRIINALSELKSGGSTNLEEGLSIAYDMAREGFEEGKINRIIIASDGVANVGRTGADEILKQIKNDADKGITLTTLGFGMGNYNDVMMEQLANHGDGNYYYIDTKEEADKLFENGATSMLQVIGSDAKIQVEFNPDVVDRFRLLGYENRRLETEDFKNDSVDAGEVGAGQTVTALYEIRIKDDASFNSKLADIRIRYKNIDTKQVEAKEKVVTVSELQNDFNHASPRFRFTIAVAEFAEILKESYWAKNSSFDSVLDVAQDALSSMDTKQEELEFIELVKKVNDLK